MTVGADSRACAHCGEPLTSRRTDARYCGARCRARAKYRRDVGGPVPARVLHLVDEAGALVEPGGVEVPGPIEAATVRTLSAAVVLDSWAGAQAVATARRQDRAKGETGASFAALGRELREAIKAALSKSETGGDPLSKMRARHWAARHPKPGVDPVELG